MLVIDDDPCVVDLVKINLELIGLEVLAAYDGLEGLETLGREKPDLVILDIHMPKLDGWDVLWEVRARAESKSLPVIMLTIESDGESVTKGWSGGVDCYLPKPFDPTELAMMTRRLLELTEEAPFRPLEDQ